MSTENKTILHEKLYLLSHESKKALMREAKSICMSWKVDILDSSKDFRRQTIDMDFEEALNKFKENNHDHFTIIRRDDYGENHIEICWNTITKTPDYFIWIYLSPNWIDIIKDFILEKVGGGKNED